MAEGHDFEILPAVGLHLYFLAGKAKVSALIIIKSMKLLLHLRELNPFTRMVRVLLLLGWLFSSHGIAPAFCMVAAVVDSDHVVKVGTSKDGALTVVLCHAGKSAAELAFHQHDALCCLLLTFAEAPSSGASDHVLAFRPVDDASCAQRLLLSPQNMAKTDVPYLILACSRSRVWVVDAARRHLQGRMESQGFALRSGRTVMRC